MIGSDAPRGGKTANQVDVSKSPSPCSWALARFGKAAYTLGRGDVKLKVLSDRGRLDMG